MSLIPITTFDDLHSVRFLPVNSTAILVELADLTETLALLRSLQQSPLPGVDELVPGASTILVRFSPYRISRQTLVDAIGLRNLTESGQNTGKLIEIPVVYDGEDLAEVANFLGLDSQEVVRRHSTCEWFVAFTGFAPGFAYLAGGDPSLAVPRRKTPRTKVPRGAVGLAGAFSAIYPQASPGGWQLIGTTPKIMWDARRSPPALLQPGDRVRFVDVTNSQSGLRIKATDPDVTDNATIAYDNHCGAALEIRSAGLLTLFQDRGRPGKANQGISPGGAMDQAAFKEANRRVGNNSDMAVMETVGGLVVASIGDTVIAVTGARAPLTVTTRQGNRWSLPTYMAAALADGDLLSIGMPEAGSRCYLAVRGGFQVEAVLGSCSTDTLAHIGPKPLANRQRLRVRPPGNTVVAWGEQPSIFMPSTAHEVVLDITLGPRTDWFSPAAISLLTQQSWEVTLQANRSGLRLNGALPLERVVTRELPSEGTVAGAIQVPASGQPVLFLRDHPLTGGYPVIGCVAPHHLDLAGQIPMGAHIRFNVIAPFEELASSRAST